MKTTLMIATAALGLALAGGAQAQVLGGGIGGGIGGNVGGSISRGNLGVRDTLGTTRGLARDTVREARGVAGEARDTTANATLNGESNGALALDRNGATVDFSGSLGADVSSNGGESLGRVVGMTRGAADGARHVLVQGADGVVRGVRTTDVEISGDGSLDSNLTAYAFRRQPQAEAPAQPEMSDNSRVSPSDSETPDDQAN